jgi:fatty-acyl-CoA synthase
MLSTGMTMSDAINSVAGARPGQEVLVCGRERLTNRELLQRIDAVARGLAGLGVEKGKRVAALLPPSGDLAALFFAAARLGAVIVPIAPDASDRTLTDILDDAQPALVVTEDGRKGTAVDALRGEERGALPSALVASTDLLALLYTSGTTGRPKATMHSHASLMAPVLATLRIREQWARPSNLRMVVEAVKAVARYRSRILRSIGKPQTIMSTSGWHTITGVHVMLQGLLMGDRLVAMPHFHPAKALQLIAEERVTILVAVPTAYQAILALPNLDRHDLSSLFICASGGAACPPPLARRIRETLGCALYNGFGMTEAAGGISVSSLSDTASQQDETVGRVMPGTEVKLVDGERREVPAGQAGELAVRGEGVMLGYYKAPELTAAVKDAEGWLYTGDIARIDEKGYLHIVGRAKDVIIRGGQNIYPTEVERYLETHPNIEEAAVVGVPSPVAGESVWAFVRLKTDVGMTVQDVLDYCRGTLEVWKIPSEVRFLGEFPRAESGKPQKFKLRQAAIQERSGGGA